MPRATHRIPPVKPAPGSKGGRPRELDRALILARIAAGDTWARLIETGLIGCMQSLQDLIENDEEFSECYTRASSLGAAALVEEAGRIVDEALPGNVRVAELRAKHRYWVASRKDPARWGDRQQHNVSGKDGGPIESRVVGAIFIGEPPASAESAKGVADAEAEE